MTLERVYDTVGIGTVFRTGVSDVTRGTLDIQEVGHCSQAAEKQETRWA